VVQVEDPLHKYPANNAGLLIGWSQASSPGVSTPYGQQMAQSGHALFFCPVVQQSSKSTRDEMRAGGFLPTPNIHHRQLPIIQLRLSIIIIIVQTTYEPRRSPTWWRHVLLDGYSMETLQLPLICRRPPSAATAVNATARERGGGAEERPHANYLPPKDHLNPPLNRVVSQRSRRPAGLLRFARGFHRVRENGHGQF
jgi:hypothetical protein